MEKIETLKDGTKFLIRNLTIADLDKLMKFYRALPMSDRKYLRIDVTKKKLVEHRVRTAEERRVFWITALHENNIIAEGRLELSSDDWRRDHGEVRLIVDRAFRHKGVGLMMLRSLYQIAVERKVKKVIAKMLRPQVGARKIARKLGFREEILLPDYVQDQRHKTQDLLIMTCDIDDFWKELETLYVASDWQRTR
ncbi:MAG: GNAT family N-acetyltransferase [Candidatus Aminicenantes bacterium]|nr:GNAT family N-acetyltransferase [Candidatus Aminicenantes bacterium]